MVIQKKNTTDEKWGYVIGILIWVVIIGAIVTLFVRGTIKQESDCNSEQKYDAINHRCISKYNDVKDLEDEIAAERKAAVEKETGRRNGTICIPASEAGNYVGVDGCVIMVVQHVYWKAGTGYLNAKTEKPDFSIASFQNTLTKADVEYYLGKRIEVRGYIKLYDGEPEIVINNKNAITVK